MKKKFLYIFLLTFFSAPNSYALDSYQYQDAGAYARIVELEEEIRSMRGQLEEANFKNQKLQEQLDKLTQDVDFRLGRLEKGSDRTNPAEDVMPTLDSESATSSSNKPASMGDGNKGGQKVLGTIKVGKGEKQLEPIAKPIIDPNPKPLSAKDQYDAAFELLKEKKIPEAISAFEDFLSKHPKDKLAGNAKYWVGEAYYVQKDYNEAAKNFLGVYKKYPKSKKAPDSLLKLAMSLAALDKKKEACTTIGELKEKFPSMSSSLKQKVTSEKKRLKCK